MQKKKKKNLKLTKRIYYRIMIGQYPFIFNIYAIK